ncbi:MAG: ribosome hibernation-promoting factor, HPF/YfiA family [Bacillota bacterium]
MNIIIKGKNMEVTPALKEYVEKKVGKIQKYFEGELEATVTLVVEKDLHRIEVTIPIDGIILRGEEQTNDMYASIDNVLEKVERQVRKYKTRINKQIRNFSVLDLVPNGNKSPDDTIEQPMIVRTKRFAVKPMPEEEAVMQMDLLGHNFFVFLNADTEEVNVVYKRKDGNYGLIEPEFG